MIQLERLCRTFLVGDQPVKALVDVDEEIRAGEHVAIMGPSGSGKSTLLNVIGCLDRPTSGSYRLDGREVARLDDSELTRVRRHKIGFVFQFFHLVHRLTAAENVELPMIFAGIPRGERRRRAAGALQAVGLSPRAGHLPDQLSGGERQRVALARATIMSPEILLADEPTGNLDSRSGRDVLDLLEGLNREGLTLVVVTHDPKVAQRADRILLLVDGRIRRRVAGSQMGELLSLLAEEDQESGGKVEAMHPGDLLRFAVGALTGHGLRTALSLLGVAIGVAAVVLLTALGEGARIYVVDQFASLGTNLLIVLPGKTETSGTMGVGGVPNDLTLEDARAIQRQVRGARRVAPIAMGTEQVSWGERRRQIAVVGTTHEYKLARRLELDRGGFLPRTEMFRGSPVAVLGSKTARELFAGEDPVGKVIRIASWRMRVIGVLAPQGTKMGMDFDDIAIVPVATAMQLFNRTSLFRILIQTWAHTDMEAVKTGVRRLLIERHEEEDVTLITQDAVMSRRSLSHSRRPDPGDRRPSRAISLTVAGVGIMNVMLVSVSERTREVGLLKAVGVAPRQILATFLTEAALISTTGGLLGLGFGWSAVKLMVRLFPALPASPPAWAIWAALGTSVAVGVFFGLMPARRATRLDPVAALGGR